MLDCGPFDPSWPTDHILHICPNDYSPNDFYKYYGYFEVFEFKYEFDIPFLEEYTIIFIYSRSLAKWK